MTLLVRLLSVLLLALPATRPVGPGWVWPLDPVPRVVRGFDPPSSPYGPGHRGVDLLGSLGQPVDSIGAGTVRFVGQVGGLGVVTVDHGRLTSTYEPVLGSVRRGEHVEAGQRIGLLEILGSHCLPHVCLHLGVRRGTTYLDPLDLLPAGPPRLKPLAGLPLGGLAEDGSDPGRTASRGLGSSAPAGPMMGQARGWACW